MKQTFRILPLALAAFVLAPAAHAADSGHISAGVGYYDIDDDANATDFRLEYRPDTDLIFNLHPWAGAEVNTDLSFWIGGGVLYDWNFASSWFLTPSFGAGFYDQGNSDKDLNFPIEFRSQLELGYQFQNQHRVSIGFSHMSNASLGDHNPGTEVLSIYWHVPLGTDF
jgi:hypothetical protein